MLPRVPWATSGAVGCASTAQITSGGRTHPRRLLVELGSFYEKVVKVKADVAAILKFLLPIPQIEADHGDAPPLVPIGGMRKGVSAEHHRRRGHNGALKPPLRGEPRQ